MNSAEEKIRVFSEIISCTETINFMILDKDFNAPESVSGNYSPVIYDLLKKELHKISEGAFSYDLPIVLSNSIGMVWTANFELLNGNPEKTYIMGPVFFDDISRRHMQDKLTMLNLSEEQRKVFLEDSDDIPVIPMTRFFEYSVMLSYCLSEKKITISDLQFTTVKTKCDPNSQDKTLKPMEHCSYIMEQKMAKLIEEGNLNHRKIISSLAASINIGSIGGGDSLRHLKNIVIINTTLCSRAAMRGGLDPEIAYTLSDNYINATEACKSLPEIADISYAMQDDFVMRVHNLRQKQGITSQIQKCMEYISVHCQDKLTLDFLSDYAGYTKTYLCKKFRDETGKNINDYITECRLKLAEHYLLGSDMSLQNISMQCGFASQSHFGKLFRNYYKCTPKQYRKQRASK